MRYSYKPVSSVYTELQTCLFRKRHPTCAHSHADTEFMRATTKKEQVRKLLPLRNAACTSSSDTLKSPQKQQGPIAQIDSSNM